MNSLQPTVDQYLDSLPNAKHAALARVRDFSRRCIPQAIESFDYGMPALIYKDKPLIQYAAFKNHLSLFASSQGTIQFTPSAPLSFDRLSSILHERVREIDSIAP